MRGCALPGRAPDPAPEEQVEQKDQVVRQILLAYEEDHRDGLLQIGSKAGESSSAA